ncbi:hypothetical protein D9M71_591020 [compost metagenome]
MVDGRAVFAGDALGFEGLEHGPGVVGERLTVVQFDALAVFGDQEEPVAAPGDVAVHHAMAGHVHRHLLAVAVRRHVADGDGAVFMQGGTDLADRGVDLVHARCDQAQVLQRGDQADGAVAAHVQVAGVVEEDHAAGGVRRHRLAVEGAHQYVVAARFQQAGTAPVVMPLAQGVALLGHGAAGQLGKALHHQASGFAAGVGVDDMYAFHELFH